MGISMSKKEGMTMNGLKNRNCILKEMNNGASVKIQRGAEVEFITKKGEKFKAILCDFTDGRLHTVLSLGILLTVPLNALTKLYLV